MMVLKSSNLVLKSSWKSMENGFLKIRGNPVLFSTSCAHPSQEGLWWTIKQL